MKTTEYIFSEYRDLTDKHVDASKHLRSMLPRIVKLSKEEELRDKNLVKEVLLELDSTEGKIEAALSRLRNIRRTLLELV